MSAWRTSTYCGGSATCVGIAYRTSRACQANNGCVGAACHDGHVLVGDTGTPGTPAITLTPADWAALLAALKEHG